MYSWCSMCVWETNLIRIIRYDYLFLILMHQHLKFCKNYLWIIHRKSFNHQIYIVTMILLYHKKSLKWWQIINCDWGYRHESGNWSPGVQSDTINEVSPASYETNSDLSKTFFMVKRSIDSIRCLRFHPKWSISTFFFANTECRQCKYTHSILLLGNMSYSVLCTKCFCSIAQRLQQA